MTNNINLVGSECDVTSNNNNESERLKMTFTHIAFLARIPLDFFLRSHKKNYKHVMIFIYSTEKNQQEKLM